MAQTIVAPPQTVAEWLAERGLVVGARVGSCVVAHHCFGTVTAIRSTDDLTIAWDNGITQTVTWVQVSPLGYVVEVAPVAASASQWASASVHLERRSEWRTYRAAGVRYVVLTSGRSGNLYTVRADGRGCSCEWYARTGGLCSHALAVEMAALEDELREAASAVPTLKSYRDIFPGCIAGCGELVERRGEKCLACLQVETRNQEIAEKRDAFGRVIPPFTLNELVA